MEERFSLRVTKQFVDQEKGICTSTRMIIYL